MSALAGSWFAAYPRSVDPRLHPPWTQGFRENPARWIARGLLAHSLFCAIVFGLFFLLGLIKAATEVATRGRLPLQFPKVLGVCLVLALCGALGLLVRRRWLDAPPKSRLREAGVVLAAAVAASPLLYLALFVLMFVGYGRTDPLGWEAHTGLDPFSGIAVTLWGATAASTAAARWLIALRERGR